MHPPAELLLAGWHSSDVHGSPSGAHVMRTPGARTSPTQASPTVQGSPSSQVVSGRGSHMPVSGLQVNARHPPVTRQARSTSATQEPPASQ